MVRSVLTMRARAGRRDEVVALFERLQILREASAIRGYLDAELHLAADEADGLLVTARWQDGRAYDAWLASPVRERLRAPLEELLAEPPSPRVYELAHSLP
jgi:quinol monooxygenase YgiN